MSRLLGNTHSMCGKIKYIYSCDICKEPTYRFNQTSQRVLCFNCKKLQHKIKYQMREVMTNE